MLAALASPRRSRILNAMMRSLVAIAVLALAAGSAAADAPNAKCKRVFVGKGLERHAVCELAVPIIVKVDPPRPQVLIVPTDGRKVVGRPRSSDRLAGLSHELM